MAGGIFGKEVVNALTNMALSNTGWSFRSSVFFSPTLNVKLIPKISPPSDEIQYYVYKETARRIARWFLGYKIVNQLMKMDLLQLLGHIVVNRLMKMTLSYRNPSVR